MIKEELYIDISWINDELSGGGKYSSFNIIHALKKNNLYKKKNIILIVNKNLVKNQKFLKNFKLFYLPSNKYFNFICRWFFLFILSKKNIIQKYLCLNLYSPIIKSNFETINLIHDMQWEVFPEYYSKLRIVWLKFNIFLCSNYSNKVLFTSEFIKKQYLNNYKFKAKTYVSYLPFNFKIKSLKPKIKLKTNSFFFVLSSNLKHKNLKLIIDIFQNNILNKKLVIAGVGQKLKKKDGNIVFLKKISERNKVWLYRNCYCYLQPSLYEGFGMTVVEALIYSRSILISNLRPFREICLNNVKYIKLPSLKLNWLKALKNKNKKSNMIKKNIVFYKKLLKFEPENFSNRLFYLIYE